MSNPSVSELLSALGPQNGDSLPHGVRWVTFTTKPIENKEAVKITFYGHNAYEFQEIVFGIVPPDDTHIVPVCSNHTFTVYHMDGVNADLVLYSNAGTVVIQTTGAVEEDFGDLLVEVPIEFEVVDLRKQISTLSNLIHDLYGMMDRSARAGTSMAMGAMQITSIQTKLIAHLMREGILHESFLGEMNPHVQPSTPEVTDYIQQEEIFSFKPFDIDPNQGEGNQDINS